MMPPSLRPIVDDGRLPVILGEFDKEDVTFFEPKLFNEGLGNRDQVIGVVALGGACLKAHGLGLKLLGCHGSTYIELGSLQIKTLALESRKTYIFSREYR